MEYKDVSMASLSVIMSCVRRRVVSWLTFLCLLLWAGPARGQESQSTSRALPCDLGRGMPAVELVTKLEESCGNRACDWIKTFELRLGAEKKAALVVQRTRSEVTEAETLTVACEPGAVRVSVEGRPVRLLYDSKRRGLALDPAVSRWVRRAWKRKAGDRRVLRRAYAYSETLLSIVSGVDDLEVYSSLSLLRARAHLYQGRWSQAEALISTAGDSPLKTKLRDRLEKLRAKTAPFKVVTRERIGTLAGSPKLPPWPEAGLFWRGSSICVRQGSEGEEELMRCYDTSSQGWKTVTFEHRAVEEVESCEWIGVGIYQHCCHAKVAFRTHDDDLACDFDPDETLAIAHGPRILELASGKLRQRTPDGTKTIDPREATSILRESSGSHLLLDGTLLLGKNGQVSYIDDPRRSWPLFDNSRFRTTLVSPDGEFVAMVERTTIYSLHLVRIALIADR